MKFLVDLEITPEPFNMNAREWFRIIETINSYMPYVESYIESINEYHLVRRVLVDNIPH